MDNRNNNIMYFEEAVQLYKKILRDTKGGAMHHLENIFANEEMKQQLLEEVCREMEEEYIRTRKSS